MKKNATIFDGVIVNENSFSNLFSNFLKYSFFRETLLSAIKLDFDKTAIDYSNFDTQYHIGEFGRPDLAVSTNDIEILFELKVYGTALTPNQPASYYNYLKTQSKAKYKALILLAADNYYDLNKYNSILKENYIESDDIHLQVIHWSFLIKQLENAEISKVSQLFNEYLSFLNNWFQLKSLFLDSLNITTMFGKEFPESLYKTLQIIDKLFFALTKQGYNVWRTNDKYFDEYGFSFQLPNSEVLFFGMWFEFWKETGYPVCVGIDTDNKTRINLINNILNSHNIENLIKFKTESIPKVWHVTHMSKSSLTDINSEKIITVILNELAINLTAEKEPIENPVS